jgi:DNA-binding response OmpR family regulator
MVTRADSTAPARVVLLEPNAALRSAILTILSAEQYEVEAVTSLDDVLGRADAADCTVALVAWQSMQGLLADEQRANLVDLSRRLRLVVMVPRRWARLLEATDLESALAGLVAKPFEADELLRKLESALATPVQAN